MTKTAELTGVALDYWVAKALGDRYDESHELRECNGYFLVQPAITQDDNGEIFVPSDLWAHGGPIIERDRIALDGRDRNGHPFGEWCARGPRLPLFFGPTPLIAAMRAKVASVYGEEIPDL